MRRVRADEIMNVEQRANEIREPIELVLARRVAQRLRRIRMRFDEQAVHAGRDARPCDHGQVLTSAAARILARDAVLPDRVRNVEDRKSTRLNSSHVKISYAVFCLKKKTQAATATQHWQADTRS